MAIKIKGILCGENPKEQLKLERKRFNNRQSRESRVQAIKETEFIIAAKGNKKLDIP